MRPNYLKLYRYIGGEVSLSVAIAFGFFFFMLFINNILLLAEKFLEKAVPAWEVAVMLFYLLPSVIALAAPFATLAGVLMAIGRLSSDSEIMAFQALGISYPRMFVPILVLGTAFSLTSFFVNDVLMPLGYINFNKRFQEVFTENPELELGTFAVKQLQNTTLASGQVENKVIQDLVIFDRTSAQESRTIFAKRAYLEKTKGKEGVISVQLEDATAIIPDPRIRRNFEYFTSEKMTYNFLIKNITSSIRRVEPQEMSTLDVWRELQKKEESLSLQKMEAQQTEKNLRWDLTASLDWPKDRTTSLARQSFEAGLIPLLESYKSQRDRGVYDRGLIIWQMEFWQKFTIPLSCVLFALLAFPIGVFNKRSGRMLGFIIAIMISFLYWSLLLGVRNLSVMSTENPMWIMIAPNILLFVLGGIFFYIRSLK